MSFYSFFDVFINCKRGLFFSAFENPNFIFLPSLFAEGYPFAASSRNIFFVFSAFLSPPFPSFPHGRAARRNTPLFRTALSFVKRLKRLYGREAIAAEPHDKPLRFQRRKRAVELKKGNAGLCRDFRNVRLGERSEGGKRRRFRIG